MQQNTDKASTTTMSVSSILQQEYNTHLQQTLAALDSVAVPPDRRRLSRRAAAIADNPDNQLDETIHPHSLDRHNRRSRRLPPGAVPPAGQRYQASLSMPEAPPIEPRRTSISDRKNAQMRNTRPTAPYGHLERRTNTDWLMLLLKFALLALCLGIIFIYS